MKKAFLPLICAAALAAETHQDVHQHDLDNSALWNITLDAGVGYAGMTVEESYTNSSASTSGDTKYVGAPGFAAHARAGFQYEFDNQFSIGIGAWGQYNTSEYKHSHTAPNVNRKATVYMDWNLGPDVRIGYSNDEKTTFFAMVAPDWGHYKFTNESTLSGVYKKSWTEDFILGVRAGVGAMQKIDENWYFQGEFDGTWFDKKTHIGNDGSTNSFQFALVSSIFSVGYMF